MSRVIKFRSWDIFDMKWRYFIIGESFGTLGESLYKSLCLEGSRFYQFTGLLDKNGKEVYEGDVLLYLYDDDRSLHRIFFDERSGRWLDERLEDGDSNAIYDCFEFVTECKVIGNIYENPELL